MGCHCSKEPKSKKAAHKAEPPSAIHHGEPFEAVDPEMKRVVELERKMRVYREKQRKSMVDIVDTRVEKIIDVFHSNKFFNRVEAKLKEGIYDTTGDNIGAYESNIDWARDYPPLPFGDSIRRSYFYLPKNYLCGSILGSAPKPVEEARKHWDTANQQNPVTWRFMMLPLRLRQAEQRLAGYIGADPSDVKIVLNELYGVSAVLKSLPWKEGDKVITFTTEREEVKSALAWLRRGYGVDVVEVNPRLPATDEDIVAAAVETLEILKAHASLPVLAVFAHVAQESAWVFPAKKLAALFHKYSVSVLIDGTQAVGHIDVNIADVAADWYVGAAHNWLYTHPGVGFIVTKPLKYACTHPLTVSYHDEGGYGKEFSYYGLQDFSTWCTVIDAFDFVEKVCGGPKKIRKYCTDQADRAVEILTGAWNTQVFQADKHGKTHYGSMPIVPVPSGKGADDDFMREIVASLSQADIYATVGFVEIDRAPTLCVKLSCRVTNCEDDWRVLAQILSGTLSPTASISLQASTNCFGESIRGAGEFPLQNDRARVESVHEEMKRWRARQRALMIGLQDTGPSRKNSAQHNTKLWGVVKGALKIGAFYHSHTTRSNGADSEEFLASLRPVRWNDEWLPLGQSMVPRPQGKLVLAKKPSGDVSKPEPALRVQFGQNMRRIYFELDPFFLNTGSYGATPRPVTEARNNWSELIQSNPVAFQEQVLKTKLKEVESRLAGLINARPADTKLVMNANYATSAVLKSLPWEPGDRVMIFSVDYDATINAMRYLTRNCGVEIIEVPIELPMTDDDIIAAAKAALIDTQQGKGPMPVLANFCHVTSKTGWIFPAKELTTLFHSFGVSVMVDGAQAAGHLPIDVIDINADWYLGTVHKWMYSCQGVGFLVTRDHKHLCTKPLTVSPMDGEGYDEEFSYCGTQDFSSWCSVGDAFDFVDKVCGGMANVRNYCRSQAVACVAILTEKWGTRVFQQDLEHHGCLPIIPLPKGENAENATAGKVMGYLMVKHKMTAFLLVTKIRGVNTLCIRVTCQIYNDEEDWNKLADAVNQLKGNYKSLKIISELGILPESVSAMIS
ncbi:putative L-cysteine desulfhydrase 1 [Diplonema papillatum]|nr:putative L-cysteine desulfhydrase 1 [Diplonema papillatum]